MSKVYWVAFGSGNPQTYKGLAPTFISYCKFDGTTLAPPSIIEPVTNQGLYAFTLVPSFSIAFIIDGATTGLTTSDRYIFGSVDPIDLINEVGSTLIALGTTSVALGTTTVALGTTAVAIGATVTQVGVLVTNIGTTLIAQGSTLVGVGNTVGAIGTTLIAQGATLVAIGNTAITQANNIGTTLIAQGSTLVAIGNTSIALGTSIYAGIGAGLSIDAAIGSTASSYGTNLVDPVDLFGYMKRIQELLEGNESFSKSTGGLNIYSRGSSQLLRAKTISNDAAGVTKS